MINNIPSIEQLEQSYKVKNSIIQLIFWLMFPVSAIIGIKVFIMIGDNFSNYLFYLFCFSLYISHRFSLQLMFRPSINFMNYNKEKLGNFTTLELTVLFNEMFTPLLNEKKEVPGIYILNDKNSSIMVVNIFVFNLIKRLNCIYISENVFQLLNKSELKAAILHEVGHFTKYSTYFNRFPFIDIYTKNLLALWFCLLIDKNLGFLIGIPLYIFLYILIQIFFTLLTPTVYKIQEYLSDYYAASKMGSIHMINVLLRLCRTMENDFYVYKRLYKLTVRSKDINLLDIIEIAKIVNEKLPPGIFPKDKINEFIKNELDRYRKEDEVVDFLDRSAIKERNKEMRKFLLKLKGKKNIKIISWREFEINKVDYRVDIKEYPYLIKLLKDNSNRQLLETVMDNIAFANEYSHPILRERILFLDKNLPPLEYSEKTNTNSDNKNDCIKPQSLN